MGWVSFSPCTDYTFSLTRSIEVNPIYLGSLQFVRDRDAKTAALFPRKDYQGTVLTAASLISQSDSRIARTETSLVEVYM